MDRNTLRLIKTEVTTRINWARPYGRISYSQEGEDLILQKMFSSNLKGFYVDVGAHHPFRYSNTYLLYLQSWRGINIDPTPGFKKLFDRVRKKDLNLEFAVGSTNCKQTIYMFKDSALNTLSAKRARQVIISKQSRLLRKSKLTTRSLREIFEKHLPKGKQINLLNIDAEGTDLKVLKSNDWTNFQPEVVLIENLNKKSNSPISKFLKNKGYKFVAQTVSTQFYQL